MTCNALGDLDVGGTPAKHLSDRVVVQGAHLLIGLSWWSTTPADFPVLGGLAGPQAPQAFWANKDVNRWNTFPARLLPARLLPASILRLVLLRTGLGGSGGSDRRAAAADLIFSRHLQRRPSCGPVFGEAGKGGALMFSRLRRRPSCGPDFGEAGGDRRGCKARPARAPERRFVSQDTCNF